MKELTFDELIDAKSRQIKPHYKSAKWLNELLTVEREHIKELMQQVREATIAECMEIYEEDWGKYTGYKKMESLPTDRIKTEK